MMERELLDGKFHFKKLPDGLVDKTKAVCTDCQAKFSYHRQHHMQAKHTASSSVSSDSGSSSSVRSDNIKQTTMLNLRLHFLNI